MEYFEDGFASWSINSGADSLTYDEFLNLSAASYLDRVRNMLHELERVLLLFEDFNLFNVKSVSIGDTELFFSNEKDFADKIHEAIKLNDSKRITSIWCTGKTGIYQSGELNYVDDIVRIGYEFFIDLISVDLFTDVWMPISPELQSEIIEDAKINSLRLEALLRTLKSNRFKINPDEGEVYYEFIAEQIGFRMFYPKTTLENIKKEFLPSLKEFIKRDQLA
jgi:hypothetical protein